MPRGVYERKKTAGNSPTTTTRTGQKDRYLIALLALRGYLAAIALSGGAVDARDLERIGHIIDEALDGGDDGKADKDADTGGNQV